MKFSHFGERERERKKKKSDLHLTAVHTCANTRQFVPTQSTAVYLTLCQEHCDLGKWKSKGGYGKFDFLFTERQKKRYF